MTDGIGLDGKDKFNLNWKRKETRKKNTVLKLSNDCHISYIVSYKIKKFLKMIISSFFEAEVFFCSKYLYNSPILKENTYYFTIFNFQNNQKK